jgi:putative ABC transport system substrate-binding protein
MGHVGFFPGGEGGRDAARRNRWDCPSRPLGASRAAAQNNVLAVSNESDFARQGGLLSYGGDPLDPYRRAASYVDRILRGEKPADLPVQFPTKFEMVVNLKTAKALGLAVPPSIMLRAAEVIE